MQSDWSAEMNEDCSGQMCNADRDLRLNAGTAAKEHLLNADLRGEMRM